MEYNEASTTPPGEGKGTEDARLAAEGQPEWLDMANSAYTSSTSYLDASLRKEWENSLDLFASRHPKGSKYNSADYRARSKLFRPKTRAALRKGEAACAAAFFSTADAVAVAPSNDADQAQLLSAEINQAILNYRLSHTIPWFLTVMGAWQDSRVLGICASYQGWRYEERKVGEEIQTAQVPRLDPVTGHPVLDDLGQPIMDTMEAPVPVIEVVADHPEVDLIPPENIRIDPSAPWIDPANRSPYLIRLIPMYVGEVRRRATVIDAKAGGVAWNEVGDEDLALAKDPYANSTQQARDGQERGDASQAKPLSIGDMDIVWVREVFINYDGDDWHYLTLGPSCLLTTPRLTKEDFPHLKRGKRPIVLGMGMLEAHKAYPRSHVQQTADLQTEANEISNLRIDNAKLALLGRYFVRAGKNVDLETLKRGVPGSALVMSDPASDVAWHRPSGIDMTAYAEQDRLNVDFDELAGNFSSASVATNRQLNETVGGMNLLSMSANAITEYDLRVFTETWVEPVLNQLVQLEQRYETDEIILHVAGSTVGLAKKAGVSIPTGAMLSGDLDVSVNVGIGATDPTQKLARFRLAMSAIGEVVGPEARQFLDVEAIIKEVFGHAGYKDGERFFKFNDQDPMVQLLKQQLQQMQQKLDGKSMEMQSREKIAQINQRGDLLEEMLRSKTDLAVEFLRQRGQLAGKVMDGSFASQPRDMAPRWLAQPMNGAPYV